MPAPKQPQDRKPKAESIDEVDDAFSFTTDAGTTLEFKPTNENLTRGLMRRVQREANETGDLSQIDDMVLDALAGDDLLELLDDLTFSENARLTQEFQKYLEAFAGMTLGKSAAS